MCKHVSPNVNWYPARLIDMGLVSEQNRVRIVEPREQEERIEGRYVTLSHKWGNVEFVHLTEATLSRFEEGIDLNDLPETFQHAIDFSCRLGVRYIWIDSLCILQDSERDWLYQSAQMDQVYNNSLCNISATAAENSKEGLYCDRQDRQVWVDQINLKTDGIPGRLDTTSRQECTILDLSFWEQNVDEAPVNKRGWVLQERLMAPRVLHFCHDQIAWECWEKDYAESRPDRLPLLQVKAGSVLDGSRLKGMVPRIDGKRLREGRLPKTKYGELIDIDTHMIPEEPSIYCYELWKRVVEVYSKTHLTKPTDKLIALAGIAKTMSRRIFNEKDEEYVAGMFRRHLESQLLWRVDPAVENGRFLFHSVRPEIYRAPSFSWAAVDTVRGIRYADATDYGDASEDDVLIKVEKVKLQLKTDDRFGMVIGGYLILKGRLKDIVVVESQRKGYTKYHWQLVKDGKILDEAYKMIYLDSPKSDGPDIIGHNKRIFCLPAARDRTTSPRELICLLLQAVPGELGTFRRIGLTKISRYHPEHQTEVLELSTSGEEARMPCPWDVKTKKHTIRII